MTTESKRPTFKEEMHRLKGEVLQARDEIRLKVHLAGMDAKDAWAKLEPDVRVFEDRVGAIADETEAELEKFGSELQTQLNKLRKKMG